MCNKWRAPGVPLCVLVIHIIHSCFLYRYTARRYNSGAQRMRVLQMLCMLFDNLHCHKCVDIYRNPERRTHVVRLHTYRVSDNPVMVATQQLGLMFRLQPFCPTITETKSYVRHRAAMHGSNYSLRNHCTTCTH